MAKPELGSKHQCENCSTKFFDLNKDPIVCPKCGTTFQVASAPTRGPSRATAAPKDEESEVESDDETVSLEDADQVEDGKVEAAPTDDDDVDIDEDNNDSDDEDTFLEEDEEDDGDVSGLIDGDMDEDEER